MYVYCRQKDDSIITCSNAKTSKTELQLNNDPIVLQQFLIQRPDQNENIFCVQCFSYINENDLSSYYKNSYGSIRNSSTYGKNDHEDMETNLCKLYFI